MYYDIKNKIMNRLIRFLLRHCYLDSATVRNFITQIPPFELDMFNKERMK